MKKNTEYALHSNVKQIIALETDALFVVKGGGRKSKVADFEEAILEEISNSEYSKPSALPHIVSSYLL